MNAPRKPTVWLAADKGEALRAHWRSFEAMLEERRYTDADKGVARSAYLLGMLDAHDIVHSAAMLDALTKITGDAGVVVQTPKRSRKDDR